MLLRLLATLLLSAALPAQAERLSIERIFGDPALSGPAPRAVKIAPDGSRVGLLRGRPDDQLQLDLWEYKLGDNALRLLVDSRALLPDEQLTEAEKARRERERTADLRGIVDYEWSPDGRRLLFPLGDGLYLYELQTGATRKLAQGAALIDPQISPRGGYVSFVRGQNLVVIELASGSERVLTHDGGGTIHNGEAEFVAQEEMDQRHGYWWAPDDSAIAFKQFDEAPVPLLRRFEIHADRTDIVEQRYPAAGQANVRLRLGLVSPRGEAPPRWIDLGGEVYLPRVDWLPDARALSWQLQSRDQRRLQLQLTDVATLKTRTLLTETATTWIELHDDLRFLSRQPAFIWASEASGRKQLALHRLRDGKRLRTLGAAPVDALLAVDEAAGLLYYSAHGGEVTGRQVYAARLDGRGEPRRITRAAGWHEAEFPRSGAVRLFVDRWSDAGTPPQTSIHAPDGRRLAWIEENRFDATHPLWPYREAVGAVEFGTLRADDGQTLHWRLRKPPRFDASRPHPAVLLVYGGPGVQMVANRWDPSRHEWLARYLAQEGYVVFTLDNRGSAGRERRFRDPIHRRLGDVEVRDQLAGLDWLAQQPWIDARRIGVYGWSYGGYMSLMLAMQAPQRIAAAVSGAPVTDWTLYDTHYTERYLERPQDNAAGYAASSVLQRLAAVEAAHFPPLLLIHGMADDNVLFLHSTQLMSRLQDRGLGFELMTYPGGKHGLSTPAMRRHVHALIADFFERRVKRKSTDAPCR